MELHAFLIHQYQVVGALLRALEQERHFGSALAREVTLESTALLDAEENVLVPRFQRFAALRPDIDLILTSCAELRAELASLSEGGTEETLCLAASQLRRSLESHRKKFSHTLQRACSLLGQAEEERLRSECEDVVREVLRPHREPAPRGAA